MFRAALIFLVSIILFSIIGFAINSEILINISIFSAIGFAITIIGGLIDVLFRK